MDAKFVPHIVIWGVSVLLLVIVALYRRQVAEHEDDTVHVGADAAVVAEQEKMAAKLGKLDRWARILTLIVVAYGLGLAGFYLYSGWVSSSTYTPH